VQRCQVLGPWLRLVGSLRTAHSQLKLTSSGSFPQVLAAWAVPCSYKGM